MEARKETLDLQLLEMVMSRHSAKILHNNDAMKIVSTQISITASIKTPLWSALSFLPFRQKEMTYSDITNADQVQEVLDKLSNEGSVLSISVSGIIHGKETDVRFDSIEKFQTHLEENELYKKPICDPK